MSQDKVAIPLTMLAYHGFGEKLMIAASQGVVPMDASHFVSPVVFIDTLITQKAPVFADPGRMFGSMGMAVAGGVVAQTALLAGAAVGGLILLPLVLPAAVLAFIFAPALTQPRICTIMIINNSHGALTLKERYLNCGVQTGFPQMDNPAAKPGETDDAKKHLNDTIPGPVYVVNDDKTWEAYHSIGTYQFQKDLSLLIGFYGTGGAISFTNSDPAVGGKVVAVAWMVPESGNPGCAVTADLEGQYKTLEKFYLATADKGNQDNRSARDTCGIEATFVPRLFDNQAANTKDNTNLQDLVLTVMVSA